jgi:glucan biosynthesis protein C
MTYDRLHYMDNLRAIVMILGVFFHAALAYSPMVQQIWMSSDVHNHYVVDVIGNFLHVFRMPLFFVVAGFFASMLIERRGMAKMMKNRALRVGLPFVIFWPLVTLGIVYPLLWAANNIENPSPVLQFVAYMQNVPDAPAPPPTTSHLWFLYYLMFFYLLTWVARQLPLQVLTKKIADLHPLVAGLLLPIALLPGLSLAIVPYPAPDKFLPELWAFGFFGLFYAYGYVLYKSKGIITRYEQWWPLFLSVAILAYLPMMMLAPEVVTFQSQAPSWPQRMGLMLCIAYISVSMSIVGLVLAKKFLDVRFGFMRYMADASYWIYITHLPIVLVIQYLLLDKDFGLIIEFLISSFGTLIICTVSYTLFVRATPIGWLLNGRRKPAFSAQESVQVEVVKSA